MLEGLDYARARYQNLKPAEASAGANQHHIANQCACASLVRRIPSSSGEKERLNTQLVTLFSVTRKLIGNHTGRAGSIHCALRLNQRCHKRLDNDIVGFRGALPWKMCNSCVHRPFVGVLAVTLFVVPIYARPSRYQHMT